MSSAARRPRAMVAAGVAAGFVSSCLLSGLFGWPLAQKLAASKRKGWDLVPVVVVAMDLKPGEAVAFETISQRSIPEQFVTPSMVRPDSASFVANQPIGLPQLAGDPLLWSSMEDDSQAAACAELVDELLRRRAQPSPSLVHLRDELRQRAKASAPR